MISRSRVYNWYISLVAAACMVLYGYDASVFNTVQGSDNWVGWFNEPDENIIGAINTAYTVGAIFGGWFVGGPVADYFGRKAGMSAGAVVVIVATIMQTFSPKGGVGVFIGGRVLVGMGQGIALTAGPIYIGECAPSHIRGKIMSFWQMFFSVGAFIAYWVGYATSRNTATLGEWDWKLVVIFQLLVPVIILSLIATIPGTPRWYIKHGNNIEKARSTLLRIRDTEQEVEDEILTIREAIEYEKEAISSGYSAFWKDPSVRKRLLLAFALNAGQQITGQGTLNNYSTIIYKKVFTNPSQIALINALNATFGILFTLNATWTVDRFGRKFLFIVGAIGMGVCMILVAAVETETPVIGSGETAHKSTPVAIALVFLLIPIRILLQAELGSHNLDPAEIFSMNIRAQAVGMASQVQNVANSVFQQFFPIFLKKAGFHAFYFFAGVNFFLAVFVWFWIPETKNVALEEMDTLFGGKNHVQSGGDILQVKDPHHATLDENRTTHDRPTSAEATEVVYPKS